MFGVALAKALAKPPVARGALPPARRAGRRGRALARRDGRPEHRSPRRGSSWRTSRERRRRARRAAQGHADADLASRDVPGMAKKRPLRLRPPAAGSVVEADAAELERRRDDAAPQRPEVRHDAKVDPARSRGARRGRRARRPRRARPARGSASSRRPPDRGANVSSGRRYATTRVVRIDSSQAALDDVDARRPARQRGVLGLGRRGSPRTCRAGTRAGTSRAEDAACRRPRRGARELVAQFALTCGSKRAIVGFSLTCQSACGPSPVYGGAGVSHARRL